MRDLWGRAVRGSGLAKQSAQERDSLTPHPLLRQALGEGVEKIFKTKVTPLSGSIYDLVLLVLPQNILFFPSIRFCDISPNL